jgi:aldose 1-epimerase
LSSAPSATNETIDGVGVVVLRDPAAGSEAHVVPEVGSNLHRFRARVGGRDVEVLAPAPDMAALRERPTRFGSATLFPYPGRIEGGRFPFQGREVQLPTGPDGNAIHGVARARPWRVVGTDGASVTTEFDSAAAGVPAEEWPWPFVLRLTTRLRGNAVRVEIEATNKAEGDMPMGLGFHPYFPASPEHEVWFDADERWTQRGQGLPTGEKQPETELKQGKRLREIEPTIRMPEGSVRNLLFVKKAGGIAGGVRSPEGYQTVVTASEGFGAMVFFTPVAPPVVSLEPHTCVPNGFNMGQMVVLKPGQPWRGWYEIAAEPA